MEIDLGGEYSFANMLRSNLEESNELNAVLRSEFPQREDVKLYSQLLDYDDFRGYDLGIGEQLERAASLSLSISLSFSNFHKPPWGALKRHISTAKVLRKLLRGINALSEMIRKMSFNKNGCFRGGIEDKTANFCMPRDATK